MASTPGTDIATLGIGVDTKPINEGIQALNNLETSYKRNRLTLDDLIAGQERLGVSSDNTTNSTKRQLAELAKAQEQIRQLAQAEKDLAANQQAVVDAGDRLIAKLQDMVDTFGKTKNQVLEFRAAQLGVTESAAPLIAALTREEAALKNVSEAQARHTKLTNDLIASRNKDIESAKAQSLATEYAANAQMIANDAVTQRTIAAAKANAAAVEASANAQMTANNAVTENKLKNLVAQAAAAERLANAQMIANDAVLQKTLAADASAAAASERLANAQMVANDLVTQNKLKNAAAQSAAIEHSANAQMIANNEVTQKALALAEKQAIEEIAWAKTSLRARIAILEELRAYQAKGISTETIEKSFSSAAIANLSNFTKLQAELAAELERTSNSHRNAANAANNHTNALTGAGIQTSRATSELVVLGRELSQGNFTRFAGSSTILAQALGFALTPMTALIGVVIALGYEMAKGSVEQDKMNAALEITGNFAGTTGEALNALAHEASNVYGTVGSAKEAVTALANAGKYTAEQIETITKAAVTMEHATGKSVQSTIDMFEKLMIQTDTGTIASMNAITRATIKLDNQYHFLTLQIIEQIRALEKDGDAKAASALAMNTFAETIEKRSKDIVENLGYVSSAWHSVKRAASEALDSVMNIGKVKGPLEDVNRLTKEINDLHSKIGTPGATTVWERSQAISRLNAALEEQAVAQAQLNLVNNRAREQGEKELIQSEAIHAAARMRENATRLQKRSMEQLHIDMQQLYSDYEKVQKQDPNSPLLDPEAFRKATEAIIKEHSKATKAIGDGRKQDLESKLNDAKAEYEIFKSAIDNNVKLLEDARRSGVVNHKAADDLEKAEYANQLKAVADFYNAQIAIVTAYNPKSAEDAATTRKRISDITNAYEAAVQAIEQAQARIDSNAEDRSFKSFTEALNIIHTEGDKIADSLQKQIEKQTELNAEYGKTVSLKQELKGEAEQLEINVLEAQALELSNAIALIENDEKALSIYQALLDQLDREIAKRKELKTLHEDGAVLANLAAIQKEVDRSWKETNKRISDDLVSAIVDGGGKGWKKLLRDMEIGFAKLVLRPIIEPISQGISSIFYPTAQQASGLQSVVGGAGGNGVLGNLSSASSLYNLFTKGFDRIGDMAANGMQSVMNFTGMGQQMQIGNSAFAQQFGGLAQSGTIALLGNSIGKAISGGYSLNGGSGNGLVNVGSAIGMIWGPIGSAIGAGIAGLVNRAFGRGPKTVDSIGIRGTISDDDVTGVNYQTWHQKGGWFRSDKHGEDTTPLSGDVVNSFTSALAQLKFASSSFAKSLGADVSAIQNYSKEFNIVLTEDAKKNEEAVTKFMTEIGDDLANKLVPGLGNFQKVGETASQTLERLAGVFEVTNAMTTVMGRTIDQVFGSTGLGSAPARDRLVEMFGGSQGFAASISSFVQNFYTDAEKLAPVQEALNASMKELNLSGITTTQAFKEAAKGLDVSSEAGAKQFAQMMSIQDAFFKVTSAAEEAQKRIDALHLELLKTQGKEDSSLAIALSRKAELSGLDGLEKALKEQIILEEEKKKAQENANKLLSLQAELLKTQGNHLEALNITRQLEIDQLSEQEASIKKVIYETQSLNATQELTIQLLEAHGFAAKAEEERRKEQLKGLSPVDTELQKQINLVKDAASIRSLNIQLMEAEGKVLLAETYKRGDQLKVLSKAEQQIQLQIYAEQDLEKTKALSLNLMVATNRAYEVEISKRQQVLSAMNQADAAIQRQIYAEEDLAKTRSLLAELMELQGNKTYALALQREKELASLSNSDKIIQKAIYALSDAFEYADRTLAVLRNSIDDQKEVLNKKYTADKEALQNAFDITQESYKAEKDLQEKAIRESFDLREKDLQNQKKAAQDISKAYGDLLDKITTSAEATSKVAPTSLAQRQNAIEIIQNALKASNTGGFAPSGVVKIAGFDAALKIVAEPSENLYKTFTDYARDQLRANYALNTLKDRTQIEVNYAEKTVELLDQQLDNEKDILDAQVDALRANADAQINQNRDLFDVQMKALDEKHEEDIEQLDSLLKEAIKQVDQLKGIDIKTKSVIDALKDVNTAVKGIDTAIKGTNDILKGVDTSVKGVDTAVKGINIKSVIDALTGIDNVVKNIDIKSIIDTLINVDATIKNIDIRSVINKLIDVDNAVKNVNIKGAIDALINVDTSIKGLDIKSVITALTGIDEAVKNVNNAVKNVDIASVIDILKGVNASVNNVDIAGVIDTLTGVDAAIKDVNNAVNNVDVKGVINTLTGVDSSVKNINIKGVIDTLVGVDSSVKNVNISGVIDKLTGVDTSVKNIDIKSIIDKLLGVDSSVKGLDIKSIIDTLKGIDTSVKGVDSTISRQWPIPTALPVVNTPLVPDLRPSIEFPTRESVNQITNPVAPPIVPVVNDNAPPPFEREKQIGNVPEELKPSNPTSPVVPVTPPVTTPTVAEFSKVSKSYAESYVTALFKTQMPKATVTTEAYNYWLDKFKNGATTNEVFTEAYNMSPERKLRGFEVGTNYIPYDMPAYLHKGEGVIPAADNSRLFSALESAPQNNKALESRLDRLTAVVEKLTDNNSRENLSVATSNAKLAQLAVRWENQGIPVRAVDPTQPIQVVQV